MAATNTAFSTKGPRELNAPALTATHHTVNTIRHFQHFFVVDMA